MYACLDNWDFHFPLVLGAFPQDVMHIPLFLLFMSVAGLSEVIFSHISNKNWKRAVDSLLI